MNKHIDAEDQGASTGMRRTVQLGIGFLLVVAGLAAAGGMIAMSGSEEQKPPEASVTPVDVVVASTQPNPVHVRTTGTVIAAQQVNIIPQVGGALRSVSDQLRPGGRFQQGDVIAQIDRREYQYAVDQQQSAVAQAEVELAIEQGRQQTARREWELLGQAGDPPDIVARGPQLQAVEANLAGAKSRLASAELSLQRTRIRAPFNAIVIAESADVGQVVGGGSIATLVGTDALWVQVSVPVETLSLIDIPGVTAATGSPANITQNLGDTEITREGVVASLAGQLDEASRTATLIVQIDDPFNLTGGDVPGVPMLPGAFVDVTITAQQSIDSVALPRTAVEDDAHVWLAADGKLTRRDVTVGWGSADRVFVTEGLSTGEQVIVTALSFPIEGMAVSVGGEQ